MSTAYSKRIHAAIVRAKMTQGEIARQAGVKRSYVAALANGNMDKPDPVKMGRVADVLGLDIRELLALTDQLGAIDELPHRISDGGASYVGSAGLAAAIRELVAEVRLSRIAQQQQAETLAELVGKVAALQGPSDTRDGDGQPHDAGTLSPGSLGR